MGGCVAPKSPPSHCGIITQMRETSAAFAKVSREYCWKVQHAWKCSRHSRIIQRFAVKNSDCNADFSRSAATVGLPFFRTRPSRFHFISRILHLARDFLRSFSRSRRWWPAVFASRCFYTRFASRVYLYAPEIETKHVSRRDKFFSLIYQVESASRWIFVQTRR